MSEIKISSNKTYATSKANERIGMTILNKHGDEMTIVSYDNALSITVQFKGQKELIKTKYQHFINGNIKRYSISNVCGHGIVGKETMIGEDGKTLKSYETWRGVLERSYSERLKDKYPTYKDVTCCDEWLYYSNFKKWYDLNYYEIDGQRMHLDKDILIKGNKIYSPDNCVFAPQRINNLFVKCNANRGTYPLGVRYNKPNNNYLANCHNEKSEGKHLGSFATPELAFQCYKIYKEKLIKLIADEYKKLIPNNLYISMMNYKVEIKD